MRNFYIWKKYYKKWTWIKSYRKLCSDKYFKSFILLKKRFQHFTFVFETKLLITNVLTFNKNVFIYSTALDVRLILPRIMFNMRRMFLRRMFFLWLKPGLRVERRGLIVRPGMVKTPTILRFYWYRIYSTQNI